jgi:hypothetical protein
MTGCLYFLVLVCGGSTRGGKPRVLAVPTQRRMTFATMISMAAATAGQPPGVDNAEVTKKYQHPKFRMIQQYQPCAFHLGSGESSVYRRASAPTVVTV